MSASDYSPLSPYSPFFVSGWPMSKPVSDMDHEQQPRSHTGDFAYFPAAPTYHSHSLNVNSRLQSARSPRKRRSSITTSASPVSSMKQAKSPARAAGNAWHVAHVASTSPGRSRSNTNVASEDTSMLGRIRSGSTGSRIRTKKPLPNRRPLALLFAPTAPPPTAPLPALPLCAPAGPPSSRLAIQPPLPPADIFYQSPASPVPSSPSVECHHAPGVWMNFGTIDEEMKEN